MARYEKEHRDMIYRIYVTDALKGIMLNVSEEDSYMVMNNRFFDMAYSHLIKPETRTAEEIKAHIIKKLEE